ncbi:uncharacterized protein VP01_15416g1 [Puccinia sorghi]|uniref:Uncharacterized protein n=1 Tax=Puccinia sorghi TaxID=27349 RepID=A0A0L6VIB4_9BASI|nr:uncharacterized protein VP01_15416g1 [Puccinia sorghi]
MLQCHIPPCDSDSFACHLGLLSYETPTCHTIWFDGSNRSASFEISFTFHKETSPTPLIITTLKDSSLACRGSPAMATYCLYSFVVSAKTLRLGFSQQGS